MHIQGLVNILSHVTVAWGTDPSKSEYSLALFREPWWSVSYFGLFFCFFRHLLVYFIIMKYRNMRLPSDTEKEAQNAESVTS